MLVTVLKWHSYSVLSTGEHTALCGILCLPCGGLAVTKQTVLVALTKPGTDPPCWGHVWKKVLARGKREQWRIT